MKNLLKISAVAFAVLLGACGGGSNDSPRNDPGPPPKPVLKVFGDSLMDSGTFGLR